MGSLGIEVILHHEGVLEMMHHSGVLVIRHLCTPVLLIYAQRYCTIYMALRPPELEQSSGLHQIPSLIVPAIDTSTNIESYQERSPRVA